MSHPLSATGMHGANRAAPTAWELGLQLLGDMVSDAETLAAQVKT
jgi:hypothetical protein